MATYPVKLKTYVILEIQLSETFYMEDYVNRCLWIVDKENKISEIEVNFSLENLITIIFWTYVSYYMLKALDRIQALLLLKMSKG